MEVAEQQYSYTTAEEKIYQLALSMVPLVGGATAKQLIAYCGSARNVFTAKKTLLERVPGVGNKIIQSLENKQVIDKAYQEFEACSRRGIEVVSFTDEHFPYRLKQIYDAPIIIYYKGTASLEAAKVVSIVGTRQATAYGKKVVEDLVAALVPYNVLIVSGMAYGIDIYAHRAALSYGLPTIGVMASGLDIIYPAVHAKEAKAMLQHGGLLTEHPLGCKPDARKFPARNRLIAGLADVTIVAEAAISGGALITANLANDYDREVFAVPGSISQPYSKGCNNLIKQHKAHIFTSVEDLISMMSWDQPAQQHQRSAVIPQTALPIELDREETAVMMTLTEGGDDGVQIDKLSWKTQIPVHQLASVLLQLEFKGLVKACPGKKFKRVGN